MGKKSRQKRLTSRYFVFTVLSVDCIQVWVFSYVIVIAVHFFVYVRLLSLHTPEEFITNP